MTTAPTWAVENYLKAKPPAELKALMKQVEPLLDAAQFRALAEVVDAAKRRRLNR